VLVAGSPKILLVSSLPSSQLGLLSETKDHQEAARAFLEKRKPDFKGE